MQQSKQMRRRPSRFQKTLPRWPDRIGSALQRRSLHTGSLDDLEVAANVEEEALKLTKFDDSDRLHRLADLGITLQSRYEHTGNLDDLNMAVRLNSEAVSLCPDYHP